MTKYFITNINQSQHTAETNNKCHIKSLKKKREGILLNPQFLKSKFSRKRKFDRKEVYVLDVFFTQIVPFFICSTLCIRRSRRTVLTPGGTDGINRWWDSGGELFGIVLPCAMRDLSNTQPPHAVAPDAPWVQIVARHPVQGAEWDEREDYTVWTSRQGHPVHQGRLLSRWLHLVLHSPSPRPFATLCTLPPLLSRVIIYLLHSFLFWSTVPSSFFFTVHPLCADTSQQPTTLYYSKVIFLPAHALTSCGMKINQENISVTSLCCMLL